jgi:hypothetical protein
MNADERRLKTNSLVCLIGVYPRSSAAKLPFFGNLRETVVASPCLIGRI